MTLHALELRVPRKPDRINDRLQRHDDVFTFADRQYLVIVKRYDLKCLAHCMAPQRH
jgi:hypothetical protein